MSVFRRGSRTQSIVRDKLSGARSRMLRVLHGDNEAAYNADLTFQNEAHEAAYDYYMFSEARIKGLSIFSAVAILGYTLFFFLDLSSGEYEPSAFLRATTVRFTMVGTLVLGFITLNTVLRKQLRERKPPTLFINIQVFFFVLISCGTRLMFTVSDTWDTPRPGYWLAVLSLYVITLPGWHRQWKATVFVAVFHALIPLVWDFPRVQRLAQPYFTVVLSETWSYVNGLIANYMHERVHRAMFLGAIKLVNVQQQLRAEQYRLAERRFGTDLAILTQRDGLNDKLTLKSCNIALVIHLPTSHRLLPFAQMVVEETERLAHLRGMEFWRHYGMSTLMVAPLTRGSADGPKVLHSLMRIVTQVREFVEKEEATVRAMEREARARDRHQRRQLEEEEKDEDGGDDEKEGGGKGKRMAKKTTSKSKGTEDDGEGTGVVETDEVEIDMEPTGTRTEEEEDDEEVTEDLQTLFPVTTVVSVGHSLRLYTSLSAFNGSALHGPCVHYTVPVALQAEAGAQMALTTHEFGEPLDTKQEYEYTKVGEAKVNGAASDDASEEAGVLWDVTLADTQSDAGSRTSRNRAASEVDEGLLRHPLQTESVIDKVRALRRAVDHSQQVCTTNAHKWTSTFYDQALEADFHRWVATKNIPVIQVLIVTGVIFHTFLALSDFSNLDGSVLTLTLAVRLGLGLPLYILGYSLTKTPLCRKFFQQCVTTTAACVLAGVTSLNTLSAFVDVASFQHTQLPVMRSMLQLSSSFSLTTLHAGSLCVAGLFVFVVPALVSPVPFRLLLSATTVQIVLIVGATVANYFLESSRRTLFMTIQLTNLMDKQRRAIQPAFAGHNELLHRLDIPHVQRILHKRNVVVHSHNTVVPVLYLPKATCMYLRPPPQAFFTPSTISKNMAVLAEKLTWMSHEAEGLGIHVEAQLDGALMLVSQYRGAREGLMHENKMYDLAHIYTEFVMEQCTDLPYTDEQRAEQRWFLGGVCRETMLTGTGDTVSFVEGMAQQRAQALAYDTWRVDAHRNGAIHHDPGMELLGEGYASQSSLMEQRMIAFEMLRKHTEVPFARVWRQVRKYVGDLMLDQTLRHDVNVRTQKFKNESVESQFDEFWRYHTLFARKAVIGVGVFSSVYFYVDEWLVAGYSPEVLQYVLWLRVIFAVIMLTLLVLSVSIPVLRWTPPPDITLQRSSWLWFAIITVDVLLIDYVKLRLADVLVPISRGIMLMGFVLALAAGLRFAYFRYGVASSLITYILYVAILLPEYAGWIRAVWVLQDLLFLVCCLVVSFVVENNFKVVFQLLRMLRERDIRTGRISADAPMYQDPPDYVLEGKEWNWRKGFLDAELEQSYCRYHAKKNVGFARATLFYTAAVHFLYGVYDAVILGREAMVVQGTVRYGIGVPMFVAIYVLTGTSAWKNHMQWVFATYSTLFMAANIWASILPQESAILVQYELGFAFAAMIMFATGLIKSKPAAVGLFLLLVYVFVYNVLAGGIKHATFMIVIFVFAQVGAYLNEKQLRVQFLVRLVLLEEQRALVKQMEKLQQDRLAAQRELGMKEMGLDETDGVEYDLLNLSTQVMQDRIKAITTMRDVVEMDTLSPNGSSSGQAGGAAQREDGGAMDEQQQQQMEEEEEDENVEGDTHEEGDAWATGDANDIDGTGPNTTTQEEEAAREAREREEAIENMLAHIEEYTVEKTNAGVWWLYRSPRRERLLDIKRELQLSERVASVFEDQTKRRDRLSQGFVASSLTRRLQGLQ